MTPVSNEALRSLLRRRFRERFGHEPRLSVAPGRVNLIGEHTDYNDGFVLPMAIDREVIVAFGAREERGIVAHAVDYDVELTIATGGTDATALPHWTRYVVAIANAVRERDEVPGAELVIAGNVPVGAGLSSSAALGVTLARAFFELGRLEWRAADAAALVQRAELDGLGVRCGIMDPFASAASRAGCATLLDCRSLRTELVPLPAEAAVVVMDTGTRRALASSEYNERRTACDRAVRALQVEGKPVAALRDISLDDLTAARDALDDVALARARHVIEENQRVLEFAAALREQDLAVAGMLMDASHASLRDLYQVSSPELDLICEIARAEPGCYGARMTGAGFGGCAVALVDAGRVADWAPRVENQYRARSGKSGALMHVHPSDGAHVVA